MTAQIDKEKEYRSLVKNADNIAPGNLAPVDCREDVSRLDKKIEHMEKVLSDGTPQRVSGNARHQMEQERKQIAEELREKMLTRKEMDLLPRHGYEYHRAVRKSIAQEVGSSEFQRKSNRYREISARLEPENPEACSIEALRKEQ